LSEEEVFGDALVDSLGGEGGLSPSLAALDSPSEVLLDSSLVFEDLAGEDLPSPFFRESVE
jgi:hypothetical protein